jgi:hypothetical protein
MNAVVDCQWELPVKLALPTEREASRGRSCIDYILKQNNRLGRWACPRSACFNFQSGERGQAHLPNLLFCVVILVVRVW